MSDHYTPDSLDRLDLELLCDQTRGLLERLKSSRRLVADRQAERGHEDPIRKITGYSAMDTAVKKAQFILRDVERRLQTSAAVGVMDTAVEPKPARRLVDHRVATGV